MKKKKKKKSAKLFVGKSWYSHLRSLSCYLDKNQHVIYHGYLLTVTCTEGNRLLIQSTSFIKGKAGVVEIYASGCSCH